MKSVIEVVINGLDDTDAYNRKVHEFLETVDLFGDSPAAAAVSDVKGHKSNAFCPPCLLSRNRGTNQSEYMVSADIHRKLLSHTRIYIRSNILRRHTLSGDTRLRLGMKCSILIYSSALPIVRFETASRSLQ